jgi:hypothetical protein
MVLQLITWPKIWSIHPFPNRWKLFSTYSLHQTCCPIKVLVCTLTSVRTQVQVPQKAPCYKTLYKRILPNKLSLANEEGLLFQNHPPLTWQWVHLEPKNYLKIRSAFCLWNFINVKFLLVAHRLTSIWILGTIRIFSKN